MRNVLGFRHRDCEPVARIYVQHYVNIRAAIANIHDVVWSDLQRRLQLIEHRHLSVAGRSAFKTLYLPIRAIDEFRSKNVVFGNNAFECGMNHFLRRGRHNVEIKMVPIYVAIENFIEQLDIFLESYLFPDLIQVLLANFGVKFRIMQQ